MNAKLKLLLSLFLFLVLTSLISYHVIGDTTLLKMHNVGYELEQTFLDKLLESSNVINSMKDFLNQSPKIFCIILTSEKNYEKKSKIIYDSWAYKCDDYRFIAMVPPEIKKNKTFSKNESIEFEYKNQLKFLQPADLVHDSYDELTDKVYLTLKDVYKRYNRYDWYLKADDDTFIFVDNLRHFLSDKNSSDPVTYGYNFKVIVKKGYHSGGAGYVLSNEALTRIGSKLDKNFKFCPNSGVEDVDVGKCLRKLDVYPDNSTDELGRERFHPLDLMGHFKGNYPDWMYSYAAHPVQKGLSCCSDTSISFHYMSLEKIVKISSILENFKNNSKIGQKITFKEILDKYGNK